MSAINKSSLSAPVNHIVPTAVPAAELSQALPVDQKHIAVAENADFFVESATEENGMSTDAKTVSTVAGLFEVESVQDDYLKATAVISAALLQTKGGDCGAPFELPVLSALGFLQKFNIAEFQRTRSAFKEANKKISLISLDKAIPKNQRLEAYTAETHNGYALSILGKLIVDSYHPVAHEDKLYMVDPDSSLWVGQEFSDLVRMVAENHDDRENCKKSSDYAGIARHAILMASDAAFFENAPIGLACPEGFFQVKGDRFTMVPLTPAHRQRVQINVTPDGQPMPLFAKFLNETFQSAVEGEEEQQTALVQEVAGAIMLGLMPRHHKAVLFYDPFGRAGKGTLEKILRGLVPASFVKAVSPFNWDKEYYVASLAGARLNVVGELPNGKPIPSASFKSVIAGDMITGRHPAGKPISFKNEAAHIFMSNYLIGTSDHTEAFFIRWLIVEFPNSLLKSGATLDTGLADRIIEAELPAIAFWALKGAERLLRNGKFSSSIAHDRLMAKWRRTASSLEEFIEECCDLDKGHHIRRSDFYIAYKDWCASNGRKAYSKSNVKELLQNNIQLRITLGNSNGYELLRGVRLKGDGVSDDSTDFNF